MDLVSWFMPSWNHLTNSTSFVVSGRFDGTNIQGVVTRITLLRNGAVRIDVTPQGGEPRSIIALNGYGEVSR